MYFKGYIMTKERCPDSSLFIDNIFFTSISEIAQHFDISYPALTARLRNGHDLEKAVKALLPIEIHGTKYKNLTAVAKSYGIPAPTLTHRIKKLKMSYEDAVFLPVKTLNKGSVTVAGVKYSSFAAAAKAHGKNVESVRKRYGQGISAEKAILGPNKRNKTIEYSGVKFQSFNKFCDHFGLSRSTARSRYRRGWGFNDIVNRPVIENSSVQYDGKNYRSILAMSKELSLDHKLVYKRIKKFKWSVKDAVEKPKNMGKKIKIGDLSFPNRTLAAKHFGVDPKVFAYRLAAGWEIEKAIDLNADVGNRKTITVAGEHFNNLSEAAKAFGLNPMTFMQRVRQGWSPEQAAGVAEAPDFNKGPPPIKADDYRKRLHEIHGDNLDFSKASFGKAQDKIEVQCTQGEQHQNFWATPNNLLRGKGCPICKMSHGARKVARWLDANKMDYEVEWTGHGLRSLEYSRATLRMDFHLPEHKTIVEFDGIQHFEPHTLGRMTDDAYSGVIRPPIPI